MSTSELRERLCETCGFPSSFTLFILIPLWTFQVALLITYFNIYPTYAPALVNLTAIVSLTLTVFEFLAYFSLPPSEILTISFTGGFFLFSNVVKTIPWTIISIILIWQAQHSKEFLSEIGTLLALIALVVFYPPLFYAFLVWMGQRRGIEMGYEDI